MSGKIRFGVYDLDRDAMELRKHGVLIRLQDQPFRVLAILAGRPGEIVTREELQEQIWGSVFVDFDQSLNKAVNRVREALNDDAGTPQYVETVPRRGYRFIAPVAVLPQTEAQGPAPAPPQPTSHRRPSRMVVLIAVAMAGVLAAIGIALVAWLRQPKKPTFQEATHLTSFGFEPTLSRDGKLLAYTSSVGDNPLHIWLQQTAGGEATPVTSGSNPDFSPDVSPDDTRIAFSSTRNGGGIFIVPTVPGEPRQITVSPTAAFPRFSPNGETILYWQDQKAFTVSADGGQPVSLPINQDFRLHGPAFWSPNGSEVLFYGVHSLKQNEPGNWWIAPLAAGQARLANLPGAERNYDPPYAVREWLRTADGHEWIIYTTTNSESWKLWRIGVSQRGGIDDKAELLVSGNGQLMLCCSMLGEGKLAYSVWGSSASIYQISITDRGQKLDATVQLPLPEGGSYGAPSLSRDGRWMAYDSFQPGKPNTMLLRDMRSGADHFLDDKGRRSGVSRETSISPDGTRVLFERDCKEGRFPDAPDNPNNAFPCGFMVAAAGGEPEQICERCTPRGFSSDGSVVLLQKYDQTDPRKDRIVALDLHTRKEQDFLIHARGPLYHPFFSWDDRWVVFKKLEWSALSETAQILIAPVRQGSTASEAEWIAVTDGRSDDDKPQISADGNTVYFTSLRDGYDCIWAQRLNAVTKHPMGEPFAFEHFHNAAGRAYSVQRYIQSDLSVARDKIVINLPQIHGDVWMAQMH